MEISVPGVISQVVITEKDGRVFVFHKEENDTGYRITPRNLLQNEGQTELHFAISQKLEKTVDFLLKWDEGCDLGQADNVGKTALHYACLGPGEDESSLSILKKILEKCDEEQINREDHDGQTPLHKAAIEGLPECVSLLLEKEEIDVPRRDRLGKSPLHYAAANGCHREGFNCVEVLLRHKFKDGAVRLHALFQNEDVAGETPFSLAYQNFPTKAVELFLTSTSDPKNWLSDKFVDALYERHPYVLKDLMDRSFSRDTGTFPSKHETEAPILVDYGPIIGYSHHNDQCQPETKFLFNSLRWRFETRKEILLHPLVRLFLLKKSRRKLRLFNAVWSILDILWLMSWAIVVVSADPYNSGGGTLLPKFAAVVFMMIYATSSLLNAMYKACQTDDLHFTHFLPIPIIQLTFATIAVGTVFADEEEPVKWKEYATAIGVLMAYVITWKGFQGMPSQIGVLVGVLTEVLRESSEILLYCTPLLVGFVLTFIIISDEDIQGSCSWGHAAKYFPRDEADYIYHLIDLTLVFIFATSIPIGFYCLLTSLALTSMSKLKEKVEVDHLMKQVENTYFLESLIIRLRLVLGVEKFTFCWREIDENVGQVRLGEEPNFQTVFRENIRRPRTDFLKPERDWFNLGEIENYELGDSTKIAEKIEALLACEGHK